MIKHAREGSDEKTEILKCLLDRFGCSITNIRTYRFADWNNKKGFGSFTIDYRYWQENRQFSWCRHNIHSKFYLPQIACDCFLTPMPTKHDFWADTDLQQAHKNTPGLARGWVWLRQEKHTSRKTSLAALFSRRAIIYERFFCLSNDGRWRHWQNVKAIFKECEHTESKKRVFPPFIIHFVCLKFPRSSSSTFGVPLFFGDE